MTEIFPSSSQSVGSGENDCPRVFEGENVLILIIGLNDSFCGENVRCDVGKNEIDSYPKREPITAVALTTIECHLT